MPAGFKSRCVPTYHLLSAEQIKKIHHATLELLESVGVRVMLPEAVHMLADAGCRVKADNLVKIPNGLVEEAISSAPSRIILYNRLGQEAMRLEDRRVHFGMGTDLIQTYDLDTGELRDSRLTDVANAARIADALEDIDFIGSYALPHDSPTNLMYLDSFKAELENSVKPIFFTAAGLDDIALMNEMAAEVVGGADVLREKPIQIHYAEPLTPLTHTTGAVKKLFFCADNGVPVTYTPGMMSGASAPVTLAGAITVGNAEALSGLVMHQLRAKGAPIISGFGMSTIDMRTSTCVYGCPEYRLALSACADLYHYYGLPMWGTAGVSDANCLDQQAGMEWSISIMADALHGANLVHDIAYLGQGLIGHPGGLVMCAEIISYVKRLMRGFELDDTHIGLDVIRQVGPGGEFLSAEQTMKFFKQEHWIPNLCNRDSLADWTRKGKKDWGRMVTDKAREILKTHEPAPLHADVRKTLAEIRSKAEAILKHKDFEA
ncbi:MAG: trimethylamine methyltransferase family protein [Desulfobacterales bacterium]|jgi:trimethylamine--corrinoid protein Co-methyltransferase|nr:trimethylamine methyltransferase family protein [Desulfobacterales bacterium]